MIDTLAFFVRRMVTGHEHERSGRMWYALQFDLQTSPISIQHH